jgi:hypothetical protein
MEKSAGNIWSFKRHSHLSLRILEDSLAQNITHTTGQSHEGWSYSEYYTDEGTVLLSYCAHELPTAPRTPWAKDDHA